MIARPLRRLGVELPFTLVVAAIVAAVVYIALDPGKWRPATLIMALALLAASLLRLVLPAQRVGLLAVRSRWWDVVCYAVLGGVILILDIRLH